MAYKVRSCDTLYAEAQGEPVFADVLAEYLNTAEADGWTLVGTLGQHFAMMGSPNSPTPYPIQATAMLIMHKPDEKQGRLLV